MNGKACKGLIVTQAAMDVFAKDGDMSKIDPDNLVLSKDEDWAAMMQDNPDMANAGRTTEEDATAACRAWYDWKKYEDPFCCQQILSTNDNGSSGDIYVVNSKRTSKADSTTNDDTKNDYGALTFKGA